MKTTKFIASTFIAAAAFVAMAGPASAHHPELAATATCTEITVTAEAWTTDETDRRHNNDVRVLIDDKQVGAGSFTADNGYRFVVKAPTTAGEHTVRVVARAEWGEAENLGSAFEASETTVSVPPCPEYAPALPKLERPPVIEQAPPTTIVEATIGTAVVVEREPAPAVLAFTGTADVALKVLFGAGMIVAGWGLIQITRKEA